MSQNTNKQINNNNKKKTTDDIGLVSFHFMNWKLRLGEPNSANFLQLVSGQSKFESKSV